MSLNSRPLNSNGRTIVINTLERDRGGEREKKKEKKFRDVFLSSHISPCSRAVFAQVKGEKWAYNKSMFSLKKVAF
jgi:hypothetical protein